jgi:hypothetical protein
MKRQFTFIGLAVAMAITVGILVYAQEPKNGKPMNSNMSDMATDEMNKRGDHVMGFDHTKTTHHFKLLANGGSIEVTANSADDTESRDQIRMHLGHIAKMFAGGNFNAPMLIHEQTPPGVPVMQKLKDEITYSFAETEQGAAIQISSKNSEAVKAIHAFLRFQINEHKTGDSLDVSQ